MISMHRTGCKATPFLPGFARWAQLNCLFGLLCLMCASCFEKPTPLPFAPTQTPTATPVKAQKPSAPTPTPTTPTETPRPSPTPSPGATATVLAPTEMAPAETMPVETVIPPATATLAPSSTPQPTAPIIHAFQVAPAIADPGDTVTLTWRSSGATHAVLYKLFYSGQLPADGWDVPTTGSFTTAISPEENNWVSFLLYVWDDAERHASAGATVELRCRHAWFFDPPIEDICPTELVVSAAAEQHFEGGAMIWVGAEDAIYVLYNEDGMYPKWTRFTDQWNEGEPDHDPALQPPPGRQQPIRGFGWIWLNDPFVRDRLGWAIESEQAYTTLMQRTTRYKYNTCYLLARDGQIWILGPESSAWDKFVPGTPVIVPSPH